VRRGGRARRSTRMGQPSSKWHRAGEKSPAGRRRNFSRRGPISGEFSKTRNSASIAIRNRVAVVSVASVAM
jgi:hypothetical protein